MPDLPTKLKTRSPPWRAHVPALEGGEAERAVGVGVGVAADPEVAQVEQAGGGRRGARERHPLTLQVLDHPLAGPGQAGTGHLDPVELHLVALGAPVGVVEVLAAAGVVGAERLDVAVGVGADPHVAPGRRDGEGADPLDLLRREPVAVGVEVGEALAGTPARPPLHLRGHPPQPRHAADPTRGPPPQPRRSTAFVGVRRQAKIMQLLVAWATSRPASSVSRACARAVRRPRWMTVPSQVSRPESTVTGRRNFTVRSSEV